MNNPGYNAYSATEEEEDAEYYRYLAEQERRATASSEPSRYISQEQEDNDEEYHRYLVEQEMKSQLASVTKMVPDLNYSSKDVKVVSLGINNHVNQSPRDEQVAKRMEKSDKFEKYQAQMRADQNRVIEETRKPYVRRNCQEDEMKHEFVIGKQQNADRAYQQKLEAQRNYQDQLRADQQLKPVEVERKRVTARQADSPPRGGYGGNSNQTNNQQPKYAGGMQIGHDEEYEKMLRRRAAIENQVRNSEAAQVNKFRETEQQNSPRRGGGSNGNLDDDSFSRGNDIRKFESAQYRYIGEQESDAKVRKHEQAMSYLQQLDQDNHSNEQRAYRARESEDPYRSNGITNADYQSTTGNNIFNNGPANGNGNNNGGGHTSGRSHASNNGAAGGADMHGYVNNSGWTGINIGGAATGNSLSRANLDSKAAQQAEYKRQLDLQRMEAIEIARRNELKYNQRELR